MACSDRWRNQPAKKDEAVVILKPITGPDHDRHRGRRPLAPARLTDFLVRLRVARSSQTRAKATAADPPSVVGSGTTESKVMPVMPTKPLKPEAASADTVNTSPPAALLIVKKSASTFPKVLLTPVAVPPGPEI